MVVVQRKQSSKQMNVTSQDGTNGTFNGSIPKDRGRQRLVIGFFVCIFLILSIPIYPKIRLSFTTKTNTCRHSGYSLRHNQRRESYLNLITNANTTMRGSAVCQIGRPPWENDRLADGLDAFLEVYAKRPGGANEGGGSLFHYYALWTIVRAVRPTHIVESGAHKGVGTWFLRQAAGPEARIVVVSPEVPTLYKDSGGRYFSGRDFQDFRHIDWGFLPPETTLLFMDDHQSEHRRILEAHERGFAHIVFDDNYLPGHGDNFSVKKVCNSDAHAITGAPLHDQDNFGRECQRLSASEWSARRTQFLSKVAVAAEFPPVWDGPNRFGLGDTQWAQLTMPPILSKEVASVKIREHGLDSTFEAMKYTHIVYVGLHKGIQQ